MVIGVFLQIDHHYDYNSRIQMDTSTVRKVIFVKETCRQQSAGAPLCVIVHFFFFLEMLSGCDLVCLTTVLNR